MVAVMETYSAKDMCTNHWTDSQQQLLELTSCAYNAARSAVATAAAAAAFATSAAAAGAAAAALAPPPPPPLLPPLLQAPPLRASRGRYRGFTPVLRLGQVRDAHVPVRQRCRL
jgi:hypothetical protein